METIGCPNRVVIYLAGRKNGNKNGYNHSRIGITLLIWIVFSWISFFRFIFTIGNGNLFLFEDVHTYTMMIIPVYHQYSYIFCIFIWISFLEFCLIIIIEILYKNNTCARKRHTCPCKNTRDPRIFFPLSSLCFFFTCVCP